MVGVDAGFSGFNSCKARGALRLFDTDLLSQIYYIFLFLYNLEFQFTTIFVVHFLVQI